MIAARIYLRGEEEKKKEGGERRERDNNKRVTASRLIFFHHVGDKCEDTKGYKGARSGWHDVGRNAEEKYQQFYKSVSCYRTSRENEREWRNIGRNKRKSERGEKNGGRRVGKVGALG